MDPVEFLQASCVPAVNGMVFRCLPETHLRAAEVIVLCALAEFLRELADSFFLPPIRWTVGEHFGQVVGAIGNQASCHMPPRSRWGLYFDK